MTPSPNESFFIRFIFGINMDRMTQTRDLKNLKNQKNKNELRITKNMSQVTSKTVTKSPSLKLMK